jgi:type I restriction enzyme M protein
MMKHLAAGGRCAVVLPEGVLFGSNKAHVELRRKLTEDFDLRAVVSLPAGVFRPYAGVKTAVVLFQRPPEGKSRTTERVWFYEITNDGYDPDRIQGGGRPETPDLNDIPALLTEWRTYKASGFQDVPGVEAGTLLEPGCDAPSSWWAPRALLAENDFNLAAGRYKPRVADPVREEDPAQLIRQVLEHERQIREGLETLLADVEKTE